MSAAPTPASGSDADINQEPDPKDCRGLELEGLRYSPGGDVLPNSCKPFHPTTNNPYAVRCIDAWPWYDTGFPGDEYCILPPPPGLGIQVGFWPQGPDWYEQVKDGDLSGYRTPGEDWVLQPELEYSRIYQSRAPNPAPFNYYRAYFRLRPGALSNFVTLQSTPLGNGEHGWRFVVERLPGPFAGGEPLGALGAQRRLDDGTPMTLHKPPEDAGYYAAWPAQPYVTHSLHFVNLMDEPLLKEGWFNLWFEQESRTQIRPFTGLHPAQLSTLRLSPGQTVDLHYAWTVSNDVRLMRIFGHRNLWTRNFSAWVERSGGDIQEIYQSFRWFDVPTFRFDSLSRNPMPNASRAIDGAASGVVELHAGDRLHFNCHVQFTDERAAELGAPSPSQIGAVRFADEVYHGEMCMLMGEVAGAPLGTPEIHEGPPPHFATVEQAAGER